MQVFWKCGGWRALQRRVTLQLRWYPDYVEIPSGRLSGVASAALRAPLRYQVLVRSLFGRLDTPVRCKMQAYRTKIQHFCPLLTPRQQTKPSRYLDHISHRRLNSPKIPGPRSLARSPGYSYPRLTPTSNRACDRRRLVPAFAERRRHILAV
jgi:hypothetical protein